MFLITGDDVIEGCAARHYRLHVYGRWNLNLDWLRRLMIDDRLDILQTHTDIEQY